MTRYQFLKDNLGHIPVTGACRIIGVSKSGYYEYIQRRKSRQRIAREALMEFVSDIFHKHTGRYGSRRIAVELEKIGIRRNYKSIQSPVREMGLQAKGTTRRYRRQRPVSDLGENLLNRKFDAGRKNSVWVGDITYIPTHQGFLYLATILDLHSRKVAGWSVADRMSENLAINAFRQARGP